MNPVRLVPGMVLILGMLGPHGAGSGFAAQSARSSPSRAEARRLLALAAEALTDSLHRQLSTVRLPVRMTADGQVRLDIGARGGVRAWSTLTLATRNSLWKGTVADLKDDHVVLSVTPGPAGKRPEAGQVVDVRLEGNGLAVMPFEPGALGSRGAVHLFLTALGTALRERSGIDLVLVPGLSDSGEARALALEAGADLLATIDTRQEKDVLVIGLRLTPLRSDVDAGSIAVRLPASPSASAELASLGDTPEAAPPGCRFATITPNRPGVTLDLLRSRFQPGDLLALFSDRIETLRFESGGARTVSSRNLEEVWPRTIPTRWAVAGVLPVNSVYGQDRREEKVFFTVCSNERPRFLVLGLDRAFPDSLDLSVSQEPRQSRTTSFDSCFPRVDRVQRPDNYRLPPGMPEDAVSRMTLAEIVIGPAGVPAMDESGRPRTRRLAVIYYHENSASLWFSAADTAYRVPGVFGNVMEGYRAGRSGPPGILLTSAGAPGEGDRLEYHVYRNGRLERKWSGAPLDGSITALSAGDLDADGQDDIVVAESAGEGSAFATRLIVYTSRPERVEKLP